MSEHRETSSRPLAPTTQHQIVQSEVVLVNTAPAPKDKRRKISSTSSNGTATDTKPTPSRRRSGNSKTHTESDAGSSHTARRSTASPNDMSTVNYTKTGRVSKAKKGLKVHDCECGRVRMLSGCQSLIPCFLFAGVSVLIPSSHTREQNT